jgi:hypothetical protein
MKLSNVKPYDISAALSSAAPELVATVWYDENGIGDVRAESGTIPSEDAIDSAGLSISQEQCKKLTKEEASKRINNEYPDYLQRNIDREALLGNDKSKAIAMNDCINGIRVNSNNLEDEIDGYTLEQLQSFDVSDETHWV